MANFEKAINITLKHEGGYVNDVKDPGGETKYGISKRSYPNVDIRSLTLEEAKEIYQKDYWVRIKLDEIEPQEIAEKIFDMGVNMGAKTTIKIAQKACNVLDSDLIIDGIIGNKTINAINNVRYPAALLKLIVTFRVVGYLDIVEKQPVMKKFLNGWLVRA